MAILGQRSIQWREAIEKMDEDRKCPKMILANRSFHISLRHVHTLRDFVDVINTFGTNYLFNERQFQDFLRQVHMDNGDRLMALLQTFLEELRQL